MTREREPLRIDHDEPASPPIHTGLWIHRIIVGSDEKHFHFPLKAHPGSSRNRSRAFDLFAGGQKRWTVPQGPPAILGVRQLEPVGRKTLSQSNEVRNLRDVVTMEHDVHSQWEFEGFDPMHGLELPAEGRCAGNAV